MRLRSSSSRRRRLRNDDADPLAGLVNLFDVAMVFAIGLFVALVHADRVRQAAARAGAAPGLGDVSLSEESTPVERFRESSGTLVDGRGQRLGTAYRLANGEVVYVPDTTDR